MLTCDTYLTVTSLEEGFTAMQARAGCYQLVAGATDLLPWAREGRAGDVHIPVLIDISEIPELRNVSVGEGRVRIGAATPIQRFLDTAALRAALPCMAHCAVWFADDQIRESATIGGNLINASPAADATPPMIAHSALLELASMRNGLVTRRRLPLADFFTGPGKTQMQRDEILVAVECDALNGYGGSFQKVGHRRSLVISVACVAALVSLDASRRYFEDVRLAVGGVGPIPRRLADVEALLRGAAVDVETIDQAARMPLHLVQSRSRQAYRSEVLRGFVARALLEAAGEVGAEVSAISEELEAAYA